MTTLTERLLSGICDVCENIADDGVWLPPCPLTADLPLTETVVCVGCAEAWDEMAAEEQDFARDMKAMVAA